MWLESRGASTIGSRSFGHEGPCEGGFTPVMTYGMTLSAPQRIYNGGPWGVGRVAPTTSKTSLRLWSVRTLFRWAHLDLYSQGSPTAIEYWNPRESNLRQSQLQVRRLVSFFRLPLSVPPPTYLRCSCSCKEGECKCHM